MRLASAATLVTGSQRAERGYLEHNERARIAPEIE